MIYRIYPIGCIDDDDDDDDDGDDDDDDDDDQHWPRHIL